MCLTYASKATGQTVNSGHWHSRVAGIACARLKLAQLHLGFAATGDACPAKTLRTSLESSCWLITASASSAAWRLASATVRSILALSEVIMSWAFRSASDTAFCSSAIAWRFTSLTASSTKEGRNPRQHRTFGAGVHRTDAWNAADTLWYWEPLFCLRRRAQRSLASQDSSRPPRCFFSAPSPKPLTLATIPAILIHTQYFFKYRHFRSPVPYFCDLSEHFTWKIGFAAHQTYESVWQELLFKT